MSCSQIDIKAYFLGEPAGPDRRRAEQHIEACRHCREELDRLRMTRTALLSLPDEEMPRRIAFVSDRIFERGDWRRLWDSGPRLGFASAAMLSAAILVHAFVRPAPVAAPQPADTAALVARIEAEAGGRFQAALEEALAESQERQARKTAELVAAVEERMAREHRADLLAVEENLKYLQKKLNVFYTASASFGDAR